MRFWHLAVAALAIGIVLGLMWPAVAVPSVIR